ncbi:hypothetical protein TSUD_61240 [Trifolium subterraneum]|uniref:SPRY domain-containing protein n=1 Tax=Trifolium subterraneum TaxID=3900 RepID=A0A2Z6MSV7_TRISU|nr:hypothetical protein TSUD_61240 [Trifolium subterraneum]
MKKFSYASSVTVQMYGSEISFFKNGVCQGVAFKDLFGGRYYPAASMYTLPNAPNCTVKFNFGPDFDCFPEDFNARPIPKPMIEVRHHGFDNRVEDSNVNKSNGELNEKKSNGEPDEKKPNGEPNEKKPIEEPNEKKPIEELNEKKPNEDLEEKKPNEEPNEKKPIEEPHEKKPNEDSEEKKPNEELEEMKS